VDLERQVQELRNEEYRKLRAVNAEKQKKKEEYVEELTNQIKFKKEQVYLSREEFLKDKEMVNKVVQEIIEEELK
jgi:phosphoenolpyruvate carboxylase